MIQKHNIEKNKYPPIDSKYNLILDLQKILSCYVTCSEAWYRTCRNVTQERNIFSMNLINVRGLTWLYIYTPKGFFTSCLTLLAMIWWKKKIYTYKCDTIMVQNYIISDNKTIISYIRTSLYSLLRPFSFY